MRGLRDLGPCSSSPARTRRRWQAAARARKQQIAFYGSTPAYRGVLELHGWGDLQTSSTRCRSRASGWRWASSSTTRSSTRSPSSPSPRSVAPELSTALRRRRRPLCFYAPYQRPRPLAGRASPASRPPDASPQPVAQETGGSCAVGRRSCRRARSRTRTRLKYKARPSRLLGARRSRRSRTLSSRTGRTRPPIHVAAVTAARVTSAAMTVVAFPIQSRTLHDPCDQHDHGGDDEGDGAADLGPGRRVFRQGRPTATRHAPPRREHHHDDERREQRCRQRHDRNTEPPGYQQERQAHDRLDQRQISQSGPAGVLLGRAARRAMVAETRRRAAATSRGSTTLSTPATISSAASSAATPVVAASRMPTSMVDRRR